MADRPKEPKEWDRKPWPRVGDSDQDKLYAAVGRALSAWERYEAGLAFLFSQFMVTTILQPSIRAYSAVRTFEGRADMLKAASLSYFHGFGISDNHELVKNFKSVLASSKKFAERRNDIAHGVVERFHPEADRTARKGYGLLPTYGSLQHRDQSGTPAYCYTSDELDYFGEKFLSLRKPAHDLAADIAVGTKQLLKAINTPVSALPRKSPSPSRK